MHLIPPGTRPRPGPAKKWNLGVIRTYKLLAPIYDRARPLWAKTIMGRAESYLEREILPRLLTPATRILDLGCGTGVNLERLRRIGLPFARYIGLDLTHAMLARAQAKLDGYAPASYYRGDIWRLPFADQSFDLVLSTWALSHLLPPQRMFDEVSRVLHPGGTMFGLFWSRPQRPLDPVVRAVERLFQMAFVDGEDLQRGLDGRAVTRRFAAGWGSSILFQPNPPPGPLREPPQRSKGTGPDGPLSRNVSGPT